MSKEKKYKKKYKTKELKKQIDSNAEKLDKIYALFKGLAVFFIMLVAFLIVVEISDTAYKDNSEVMQQVNSNSQKLANLEEGQKQIANWATSFSNNFVSVIDNMLEIDRLYSQKLGLDFESEVNKIVSNQTKVNMTK